MNSNLGRKFAKKQSECNTLTQVNSSILQKEAVQGAFINLKPSMEELESLAPLWNAVDAMIVHDCFIDNNPMRLNSGDILFWDWTIVTVNGFSIPAPIHTCSKSESYLYTYCGTEVILSNEECAYTTAIFYLDYTIRLALDWNRIEEKIHPILKMRLEPAVSILQKISAEDYSDIMQALRGKLSEKGFSVLD